MDSPQAVDAPTTHSELRFGPGFPGKVWLMCFAAYARAHHLPLQSIGNRRSDGNGNIWQVSLSAGKVQIVKFVDRVRIEAAEIEATNLRNAYPMALSRYRARLSEFKRRKRDHRPPQEVEDAQMDALASEREVRFIVQRHNECAEMISKGMAEVYSFPVEALEKLIFGDVPISVTQQEGPRMNVQPLSLPPEILAENAVDGQADPMQEEEDQL